MNSKTRNILIVLTYIAALVVCILFPGCSTLTPQQQQVASTLSAVAVSAASAYFHLPPGDAQVLATASNALWGGMAQAQAGQSPAQGTVVAPVGQAIAAKTPSGLTPDQTAQLLALAASQLTSKK